MALGEINAEDGSPGVSKEKYFALVVAGLEKTYDLFSIAGHLFDCHGGGECFGVVGGVGFAGAALVPLDDGEVVFPWALEGPCCRHRRGAGASVEEEEDGIAAVAAADGEPLRDAVDLDGKKLFDTVGGDYLLRVGDDGGDFAAGKGLLRLWG